ncbi:hypothetical protein Nmel_012416 [Mimus melanotis]
MLPRETERRSLHLVWFVGVLPLLQSRECTGGQDFVFVTKQVSWEISPGCCCHCAHCTKQSFELSQLLNSWIAEQLHTDLDPGSSKIKYILSGDGAGTIFVINDKTGDIHAMKRLDREEKAEYTLTAQAVDRDTKQPLEPPSEFIIKVQDINDNAPEFVEGPYHATVPEMSLVGTYV